MCETFVISNHVPTIKAQKVLTFLLAMVFVSLVEALQWPW